MIRYLAIQNLAVIEATAVEFEPGFNVLTGETGAGKSILVEALGLLIGGRASQQLLRTGTESGSVEAIFDTPDGQELIVRRELTAQGRSRAFVNGALVTTAGLKDALEPLVEIHGQHEHQQLLDPEQHLPLLDAWAGLQRQQASVAKAFEDLRAARQALDRIELDARERQARLDLLDFQLGELDRAVPEAGEDERLSERRAVLRNAERFTRLCAESYDQLYEHESSALSLLDQVARRIGELAAMDPVFAPHVGAYTGIKAQLEDLAFTLRDAAESLDASPAKLEEIEERLALLERTKRKYGPTLDDVITRREALTRERNALRGGDESADALQRRVHETAAEFSRQASALSAARHDAAPRFSRTLEAELGELAMARTRAEMRLTTDAAETKWTAQGLDRGELFLSANVGEDLRPLARIVSGGELSRIMLALKTIAALDRPGTTLVFDEVDTGIGGRVATTVARKLRELGRGFQVLCITHLPQIAAAGDSHFQIAKAVAGGRTTTTVTRLGVVGRLDELGRMLAGESAGDAARGAAEELFANMQAEAKDQPEAKAKGESPRRAKAKAPRS